MFNIPSGTVTFLFTDIQGSTKLLQKFGDHYPDLLAEHQIIIRSALEKHHGYEVNTDGDAFFVAFARAADGVAAAVAIQKGLAEHAWPENGAICVRMSLHTGEPKVTEGDYAGLDVHRGARIREAAHGGQVLISGTTKILAAASMSEGVGVRDLGEHRLKDLERPEHLYQLVIPGLRSDFPPIRSLNNCPNNLPAEITRLIGREKELAQMCELLRRSDVRFVTLTGPGGAGKTLLALQVASALLADFADGAFLVDLADISDPNLVPAKIADVLGVEQGGVQPLLARLTQNLRDKKLLLLLDNLEQVTAASMALSALIEGCPHLKILATSRTLLCVRSERTFHLPALEVPSLGSDTNTGTLLASPAVRLFIERAKAIKGDFVINDANLFAVVRICSLLDGLPLAIELAAARVKLLSPEALLSRLVDRSGRISLQLLTGGAHDLPPRQQTIRNLIAWSYELLDAESKRLFCRLAVFDNGCTLAAAEKVCEEISDSGTAVVDGIAALIDCSLIRHLEEVMGEPRIGMLQTIREFGLEQLRKSGAQREAQMTHAGYYAAFAEEAESGRIGPDYAPWARRIEVENDNFRSSLTWATDHSPGLALRIASAVGEYWFKQARWMDLRTICEKLALVPDDEFISQRSRCLRFAGLAAKVTGDAVSAETHLRASLALSEQGCDKLCTIEALNELGGILVQFKENKSEAVALFRRALELAQEVGEPKYVADCLFRFGGLSLRECEFENAREKLDEAAAIYRKCIYPEGIAQCMASRAAVGIAVGEYERASASVQAAVQIHDGAGDCYAAAWDRYYRGQIAAARGQFTQAQIEFEECNERFRKMNTTFAEAWCLYELGNLALAMEDLVEANELFERSRVIFRSLGRPNSVTVLQLGMTALQEGRFRTAQKLLQKSLTVFREAANKLGIVQALTGMARLGRMLGDYTEAESHLRESLSLTQEMDSKRWTAVVLEEVAQLANARQRFEISVTLFGKTNVLREEMGSVLSPCDKVEHEAALATARNALGDEVFNKNWLRGAMIVQDQFPDLSEPITHVA